VKLIALIALVLAAGCVSAPSTKQPMMPLDLRAAIVGSWFSGQSVNRTDYRLDDCQYKGDGTFSCTLKDHGCSADGFCEVLGDGYSGTWSIEGTTLVREVSWGSSLHSRDSWVIKGLSGDSLLVNETKWFRNPSSRNKYVLGAL
jgi:hypothetical protein